MMARDLKVLDMAKWGRKFQPCLGLGYKLFKRTKVDESGENSVKERAG